VFYYDESFEDPECVEDSFLIRFQAINPSVNGAETVAGELVGNIDVSIRYEPNRLYLNFIEVEEEFRKKGFGKRFVAIFEDIAKRMKIKLLWLSAVPERVSFYLDLPVPYTFADNEEGIKKAKYQATYTRLKAKNGVRNENAKVGAGLSLVEGDLDEPLVNMMKKLPRKQRKQQKQRVTRKKTYRFPSSFRKQID